jgi:hypothetical protein
MKAPSGRIHIFGICCVLQGSELNPKLTGMLGLDAGFRAGFEKLLQPLVPEAFDHV